MHLVNNVARFLKSFYLILTFSLLFFLFPTSVFAQSNNDVAKFTSDTLGTLSIIASLVSVIFIIKGGYMYMTSSGNPLGIDEAKKTIKNALLGLIIVLSATAVISLFHNAFTMSSTNPSVTQIELKPIEEVKPAGGLTQVLIDAINGFLQNIIQSATKPIVDGIIGFLTTTPQVTTNSVVFNYWLIILGIVDSLFALVAAVLGFQLMSAKTFGFEEIEFKHILPRLGLAFLGANVSIFLADWVILASNTLVKALLNATGGIEKAWILNAIDVTKLVAGPAPILLTLIFMLLFIILSIALLLFYISRLIIIAFGVVIAPFIFLLWALPKTSDFAEIAVKSYFVTVFTLFVHVIIIQLSSAFLILPGQQGTNSLMSILVAIGLFFTLLKTPSLMYTMITYTSRNGSFNRVGNQIVNVISSSGSSSATRAKTVAGAVVKIPRKVIRA